MTSFKTFHSLISPSNLCHINYIPVRPPEGHIAKLLKSHFVIYHFSQKLIYPFNVIFILLLLRSCYFRKLIPNQLVAGSQFVGCKMQFPAIIQPYLFGRSQREKQQHFRMISCAAFLSQMDGLTAQGMVLHSLLTGQVLMDCLTWFKLRSSRHRDQTHSCLDLTIAGHSMYHLERQDLVMCGKQQGQPQKPLRLGTVEGGAITYGGKGCNPLLVKNLAWSLLVAMVVQAAGKQQNRVSEPFQEHSGRSVTQNMLWYLSMLAAEIKEQKKRDRDQGKTPFWVLY